jgi:hypothetical protein
MENDPRSHKKLLCKCGFVDRFSVICKNTRNETKELPKAGFSSRFHTTEQTDVLSSAFYFDRLPSCFSNSLTAASS